MELYIIRHTKVAIEKGVCYGQTDVPLAKTFTEEAAMLKTKLPTDFEMVYTSPLERCQTLAEALDTNDIQVEPRLMEMNFGDWENQKWDDIPFEKLNQWMSNFVEERTPNGENLVDVYNRVGAWLNEMRHKEIEKALVVTHAGVIRCLWGHILEVPLKNLFRIPVGFGEVLIVKLSKNKTEDLIKQVN